jgi:hypothetical protein
VHILLPPRELLHCQRLEIRVDQHLQQV